MSLATDESIPNFPNGTNVIVTHSNFCNQSRSPAFPNSEVVVSKKKKRKSLSLDHQIGGKYRFLHIFCTHFVL